MRGIRASGRGCIITDVPGGAGDPTTDAAAISHADPHLVVRCARHYERAAAIVVSAAVHTASLFVEPPPLRWGLSRAADNFQGGPGAGREGEGREAEAEKQDQQDQQQDQQRGREERQAKQLSDRVSRMNSREQAMARHSQVHVDHEKVAADNARRTQRRHREERQRWELQQRQQQPQEQRSQEQGQALPVGASVTSRAAARIDLAGGWTDTPPISYEAGGSVVNVAVTVSGERPVEARCERIEARGVELVCEGQDGAVTSRTVCSSLRDFE